MNRKECLQKINEMIPDENVKKFIFNSENLRNTFLTDKNNIFTYLSNILVLSFGMIFARFLEWKEKKKSDERFGDFSNSMIRIYNTLNKAYDDSIVSFDLIDTVINNLQIDYLLQTDIEMNFLTKFNLNNNYFAFNEKFSKILYEIQKKRISSRYINDEIDYDSLINFLEVFPYLGRIKIVIEPFKESLSYENNKCPFEGLKIVLNDANRADCYSEILDLNFFLITDDFSFYFLEKINISDKKNILNENENIQIIYLDYLEISWTKRTQIALCDFENAATNAKFSITDDAVVENFFIHFDITKYNIENNPENFFFKDFYSLNNIYLKKFALVVSDCLDMEIKQALIETYSEKYKQIFELLKVNSLSNDAFYMSNYDWDALIMMLFLEEGIYKILSFIINTRDIYNNIIQKFISRYNDSYKNLRIKIKLMAENPTCILMPSDLHSKKKEIVSKVNALIKLATELFSKNELPYSDNFLPANISLKIENLKNVYISNRSIKQKISFFIESTLQITKIILVFYESFLEYAKVINEIDFKIASNSPFFGKNEIDVVKKKAIDNFVLEVNIGKKNYANVNNLNYSYEGGFNDYVKNVFLKIFNKLKDFNERCSNPNSVENKTIRRALGRSVLMDADDLNKIIELYTNLILKTENQPFFSDEVCDELYNITSNYLHYIQCGTFNDGDFIIQKAVYPLMGTYNNSIVSRDGYLSASFTIDMPNDEEKKIKVLSDDTFQFCEEYFCMPNLNRIAKLTKNDEELWVSPIILNYKFFSQNFFALYMQDKHNEKDYQQISRLIYDTDTYIYSALFGNRENAVKVLPVLFKVPRSMFSIDKYVTVKYDDEIIAVGSVYRTGTSWDRDIVLAAMKKAEIEIPISFESACKYFEDTYNDLQGNDKNLICDICVDEKYRSKGVGKFLLSNIVKSTKMTGRDLLITVYANNYPAINLYKSLDFIEYERFYDDRGYNRPKEICIKMVRFSNI